MKIEIQLPLQDEYYDFISSSKMKQLKNKECVYKLSFEDGKYYIGRTSNLAGRIHSHCQFFEPVHYFGSKPTKPTPKEYKMNLSIKNKDLVLFEILDEDSEKEKSYIQKHKEDDLMLNVALRK